MKFKTFLFISFLAIAPSIFAQVGVNTATPEGALDISSATGISNIKNGFVYPVVALDDVTVQEINNPNPSSSNVIVQGTTVYNTNTNTPTNIANSVYPGIYVWNGSVWVPQFSKRDNIIFEQISLATNTRPSSLLGDEAILFDVTSNYPFSPKYNGSYKIKLTVHYGGGAIDAPTGTQYVNFGAEEGEFTFTFNGGTPKTINARSFSGYNTDDLFNNPATDHSIYTNNYTQTFYVMESELETNNTYTFSLNFNQENAPGFEEDGNIGAGIDGRGYITVTNNIKCTIEFTYIGE